MKRLEICILTLVLLVTLIYPCVAQGLITACKQDTIAGIAIDDSSSWVWKKLGQPDEKKLTDRTASGNTELHYIYNSGIRIVLTKSGDKWYVERIIIESPSMCKTSRGIGIGSSIQDVLNNYEIRTSSRSGMSAPINDYPGDLSNKRVYCGTDKYGNLIEFYFDENGKVKSIIMGCFED